MHIDGISWAEGKCPPCLEAELEGLIKEAKENNRAGRNSYEQLKAMRKVRGDIKAAQNSLIR